MARSGDWRPGLVVLVLSLAFLACTPGGSTASPAKLAIEQQLRIGVVGDPQTLDPALLSDPVGVGIAQNVFGGLYRLDDNLNEVPDIAESAPRVSPDGLTYTFQLRKGPRFSNGDPVTAPDVVYSWSRVAALQGPYANTFSAVSGYDQVAQGATSTMTGLTVVDAQTLIATLTSPTGWFLAAMSMWWADVVDHKVIEAFGQRDWWKTPAGLVGTGPFQVTGRVPGQSLTLTPVPHYWRGPTGALSGIQVGIEPGPQSAVGRYAAGAYDILLGSAARADGRQLDARVRKDVRQLPDGKTDMIGFNLQNGPFAGRTEGLKGRLAFSLAIDRQVLTRGVCGADQSCHPATGGLIPDGLRGHLGDDPNAHFNPERARALYRQWDPDGSKVKGLTYHFESFGPIRAAAQSLHAQWKANLGVDVSLAPADPETYQDAKNRGSYAMFREGWGADYNHPQNWYQLFRSDSPLNHFGYNNPRFDSLVHEADTKGLSEAMVGYAQAGRLLIEDVVYAGLLYVDRIALIKPYVQGAGGNALSEHSWTEIRLLRPA